MKPVKIHTCRNRFVKFLDAALELAERSWWPAIIFYLLVFTGVTVANLWAAP